MRDARRRRDISIETQRHELIQLAAAVSLGISLAIGFNANGHSLTLIGRTLDGAN